MISRKNYCKKIVNRAMLENNVETPEELASMVYGSTTLGIALETLGYITKKSHPEAFRYLRSRAGAFETYAEKTENGVKIEILTFREFLNLLPEEVTDED